MCFQISEKKALFSGVQGYDEVITVCCVLCLSESQMPFTKCEGETEVLFCS